MINAENYALRALRVLGYTHARNGCECGLVRLALPAAHATRKKPVAPSFPSGAESSQEVAEFRTYYFPLDDLNSFFSRGSQKSP